MREITIPEDVPVKAADGTEMRVSFVQHFLEMWLSDPQRFGTTPDKLRQAMKIGLSFAGKSPGAVVQVEDSDWALLRDAAERPTLPYNPAFARFATNMIDALLVAKVVT